MKTFEISINERELDLIMQALGLLEDETINDRNGYIKRKMPTIEAREKYLSAIRETSKKFINISMNK